MRISGPVRPRCERLQEDTLVALEALSRLLLRGAVDPDVGRAGEPALELGVQVMVVQELPAVKEVAAHVAHRPPHLPFGLGPVGSAGAGREAPVRAEAEELGIVNQPAPVEPLIIRDDRPHLIEEQFPGDTAEERERLLKARQQGRNGQTIWTDVQYHPVLSISSFYNNELRI